MFPIVPNSLSRLACLPLLFLPLATQAEPGLSVADYDSIQAALDANPNRMLFVPQVVTRSPKSSGSAGREPVFSGRGD
jgi:hypothetical protein